MHHSCEHDDQHGDKNSKSTDDADTQNCIAGRDDCINGEILTKILLYLRYPVKQVYNTSLAMKDLLLRGL